MIPPPMALLAELTYRCPLRCGYCSNPEDWGRFTNELDTETWQRVMTEAGRMGVYHVHLSGGEPLLRDDLERIVARAHYEDLYVNLITSGWGATEERIERLARAGIDHVQVSFQDTDSASADRIAGTTVHAHKLKVARWVRAADMELSVNVVLHRSNIARVGEHIALAESLGAQRIELASAQYHGSALVNRRALLPSRVEVDRARETALRERERLKGRMDVIYVIPDYHEDLPRPCTDGWGRRFMTVIPDGTALPCAGAHSLPGMVFDKVTDRSLADIWNHGADFARFRGTDWMPEPCASCERRTVDHGGCRCQAFALTGDVHATDPACAKSPHHDLVRRARDESEGEAPPLLYRLDTSRRRRE